MVEKKETRNKKITITIDEDTYKKLAHKKINRGDRSYSQTLKFLLSHDC